MGFRSIEETSEATRSSSSVSSLQELTQGSERSREQRRGSLSPEECESRFGLEVYRSGMEVQIQRLVQSEGPSQVRQWADEGMTVDTMGKPRDMEAFRERQQQRPAEVPRDIERRNQKSVQRSKGAHNEGSKAGDSNVPDSVRDVISSSGQSLDTSIQRAMEDRMGDSFGGVRVHTGPKAAKACQDINARAFTAGNHIAFNHGEYDPSSTEGQHLLAHELAHVRQQSGGAVSMMPQEDANLQIDPDPRLEKEAEEAAQQAMQDGPVTINRMGAEIQIQRMPEAEQLQQARNQAADDSTELTLVEEVEQIKTRLSSVEQAVAGESTLGKVGKAMAQGSIGGVIGAFAGSAVSPGVGTVAGAAVGQEVAKGVSGDVTKTVTGQAYDKGTEAASKLAGKADAKIEQFVRGIVKDVISGSDFGGQDIDGIR